MSDTEQDDTKRRQRARFVDALTKTAQQPGDRSRVGTKVAGAAAVLALAAGATMGIGAWRSYQSDQDSKEKLALKEAAQQRRIVPSSPSASASASEKPAEKARTAEAPAAGSGAAVVAAPTREAAPSPSSSPTAEDSPSPTAAKKSDSTVNRLLAAGHSRVLLKNVKSGMCADISGYGAGKVNGYVMQYYCDGSAKDNQLWSMVVRRAGKGPGGADLVSFINVKDDLCIDLPGYKGLSPGWGLVEGVCNTATADNQEWWLDPAGGGTVRIRNLASGNLCMEVKDDSTQRAARLQLDKCGTDADSRWIVLS
ncbi:putative hydrolytic protein [Streptomyces sp. Tu6071]|uniref:RICIN domain-containing protein n=1 Tax=Streptomyces sp. Tu6071 TaxID=355249 RepID=UPI00020E52DD|nr:RICIN domain-containing protein [Streptomyces sp. Tu6071]EGJ73781.1 putative hydrolytic protein [Streptomyces sp. Tu6071]